MNALTILYQLEGLSLREKVLIAGTVAAFFVSMLQFFLVDPRLQKLDALSNQVKNVSMTNQRLALQLEGSLLMPNQNRQTLLNEEISELQAQVDKDDEMIRSQTVALIPATKMPALLQDLLSKQSVQLVALKNVPPIPLMQNSETDMGLKLYQHGIQFELKGGFHQFRRYLIAVENQPWKLLWQSVHYESGVDGSGLMRLEVQTLSTDNAWLGV